MTLANVIDTFSGSENPVIRLVNGARKDGSKVRVISTYDVDAVVASAVLIKYLLQIDVRYEFLTLLDVDSSVLGEDVPTISFDSQFRELKGGVCFVRGERQEIRKLGNALVVSAPYYSYAVLKALEDFMVVTSDVRYFVLASMLSRYVPRIKVGPIDDVVKGYIKELVDLNALKVVRGLKVFNYSLVEVGRALNRTLDIFVPGFSGVSAEGDFKGLSEDELSREVLSKVFTFSQHKFLSSDVVGDNYFVNQDWFFRDVYEFLYALMTISDIYGVQYIIASMVIPNYLPLVKFSYEGMLTQLMSTIYRVKEVGVQQIKKNVYKVRLNSLTALTPLSKVIKAYLVPSNSVIIYEVDNSLYMSLIDNTLEAVSSLVKGSYERLGSLVRFKELKGP